MFYRAAKAKHSVTLGHKTNDQVAYCIVTRPILCQDPQEPAPVVLPLIRYTRIKGGGSGSTLIALHGNSLDRRQDTTPLKLLDGSRPKGIGLDEIAVKEVRQRVPCFGEVGRS